jgi:alpha-galactosidase
MRIGIGVAILMGLVSSSVAAQAKVDVNVRPDHEVRYTSGKTIYVEGLVDGRWVGRYWTPTGRINTPHELRAEDAFQVEFSPDPDAKPVSLSDGWNWVSAAKTPQAKRGTRHFVVELSNTLLPVRVKVHTLLDGTSVLTRWLEITNTGARSVALTSVAPWSGQLWNRDAPVTAGYSIIQGYQKTGSFAWRELQSGPTTVQNLHEPCYDDPYFILRNESKHEYFFGQLAWPSLYSMEFNKTKDGLSFKIGPTAVGGALRVIAAGETVETPAVHLCHYAGDFDGVVQEMHQHVRRSVSAPNQSEHSYRVEYIANSDTGNCLYKGDDFNESNLRSCADVAAAIGCETFLIDGPFWAETGGNHDYLWEKAVPKLFPSGMRAFRDYLHGKGLLLGLYCRTEGRNMLTSGEPDTYQYIKKIVDTHGIDLYRHDTSEDQWGDWVHSRKQDGFDECIIWRHHDTFYKACDRILKEYPRVTMQQAAAGGARSDLATVARYHESFQSDVTDDRFIYQAMAGFSVYLPPEVMQSAYFGMSAAAPADKTTVMRSVFTLGNVPCFYWTLAPGRVSEMKPEDLALARKYTELYKSFMRPLLPTCRVFHHAPINSTGNWDTGDWFAMEYASPNRSKGWATFVRIGTSGSDTYLFKPRGLDRKKTYRVTFDSTGEKATLSGMELMGDGLTVRLASVMTSELLLFEAQ